MDGVRFRLERGQAAAVPNSRLDRIDRCTNSVELAELCDEFMLDNNEFLFQRNLGSFPQILRNFALIM